MNRMWKERLALLRSVAALGVVGAACLTRPVVTGDPFLKTNFTSVIHSVAVDKLDILFMVDNSASMGDKQALLAQAVPDMINRLVSPNCVDAMGNPLGPSVPNGCGANGKLEFPAVHDMHLGIVTSSLGLRGATGGCDPNATSPQGLAAHNDDQGRLINRGGADEHSVAKAAPNNFLAWFPPVQANMMGTAPMNAETAVGDPTTVGTLIGDFTDMISGVHEHGCGFEAQNEAWYRFLVQPDPFQSIQIGANNQASLQGVDSTILQQRRAFLRPDSLLAIIVVTDENEEVANPLAVSKEGWLYEQAPWPQSPSGGGAPQGTIECQNNPNDPKCESCAFTDVVPPNPNFATRCPKDGTKGAQGYLDPVNDNVNVRFFNQKQRFGVFSGYPLARYIRGLTSAAVPDRNHESDNAGNYVADLSMTGAMFANCVNPIFAKDLPTDATNANALCNLNRGPRTPDLVYYAVIGGVPHQLLQAKPGDPECKQGQAQADCPQKDTLAETDWQSITGKDPEHYDFTGADFHMLESEDPRAQSQCAPNSNDNCDPINGREWSSNKGDLQYACIFPLAATKDCQPMGPFAGACDCQAGATSQSTPLCQKMGGAYTTIQINGKAYPSVREMAIAHAMANQPAGVQGIVSSMCPIHAIKDPANPTDPVYGYRPAVNAIINRLKNALSVQCLPQKLNPQADGTVPCLVLVTLPTQGGEELCNTGYLKPPPADVLTRFRSAQHAVWVQNGGSSSVQVDPNLLPVCQLKELIKNAADGYMGADCSTETVNRGWCYVEGSSAGGCPQQLLFTTGEPPQGAQVNLQCIEQANGVVDGG